MMKKSSLQWLIQLGIILMIFLCGYVLMLLAPLWQPILHVAIKVAVPFLIAGLITYILHPIVEQLHNMGLKRPVAVLLIFLLFIAACSFLLVKGTPYFVAQVRDLGDNIPIFIETYRTWVGEFNEQTASLPEGFHQRADEWLAGVETAVAEWLLLAVTALKGIFDYFLILIIVPFLVFYLLKDFQLLKKISWYLTPRKWRESGRLLIRDIDTSLGNYIRGQILVCLTVGIIASIGMLIIGMPYPILLGVFIGMTNIIPYFGPIIGAIPVLIIALTVSFQMVLMALAVNFTIQLIEGNILSPLIVGKSLHMHPVIIMFALILGAEVAGVIGLILSVPIIAIIKVIFVHVKMHVMSEY
ncbi:AI-2E family transporter [Anaerobacillus sp. MEB173]|uniref:AI-2E family transporter n=1 Tax=Anaerobacillus sp. MEB173 TaxID=3383345 RepID=UPI003F911B7C